MLSTDSDFHYGTPLIPETVSAKRDCHLIPFTCSPVTGPLLTDSMNKWLKKLLTRFSYSFLRSQPDRYHRQAPEIVHTYVLPYSSYSPWVNDPEFQAAYAMVKTHTLVDIYRLYELWSLVRQLDDIEGDFLEVGVWRGGSGCLLALAGKVQKRRTFLADTFSGVVKTGARDTAYVGGEHADTGENLSMVSWTDVVCGSMSKC